MNRLILRKSILVLAIVLFSAFAVFRWPLRLGLDLRGGASLVVHVKVDDVSAIQKREVVEQTRQILERRINAYGLSEAPVQPYGSRGDELLVQLPGVSDVKHIKTLLQSRSVLEWYSVEQGPYGSAAAAIARFGGVLPANRKLFATRQALDGERGWYLVDEKPVIRGSDLRDARVSVNAAEQPATTFLLSVAAAPRFEDYTRTHQGQRAAIVIDQEIVSVPVIEEVIRDSGQIRGARTFQEAEDLAMNLRSGALPAAIAVVQEHTVEASLGKDSIRHGVQAGLAGLAAVVAAMLLYYRSAGVNATLALLLNGLLLMAVLASFDAVLTLPGMAGVVLTIGMAVDSNVLIFERIREEVRAGKPPGAALAAGFSKAFATLIDTHVTTVVSCAFLFLFGTPAVKGFAITLVIGLATNLFTSVFVSRLLFDWELAKPESGGRLSIGMAR